MLFDNNKLLQNLHQIFLFYSLVIIYVSLGFLVV